jgi:hypothetical protein
MKERWGWWVCEATTEDPDDFDWCEEIFGCPSPTGRWFYEFQGNKYYFKNKTDAAWYELRWHTK